MKPDDLAKIQQMIGTLASRYGGEPMEHQKPQSGTGDSKGGSLTATFAEAIATMALAESIDNLAKAVSKPRTRTGRVMLPDGHVEMTITEHGDGRRHVHPAPATANADDTPRH